MPGDDSSEDEWDTWAELQELQAILVGLMSRKDTAKEDDEEDWLQLANALLAKTSVLALLGAAADDARDIIAAMSTSPNG